MVLFVPNIDSRVPKNAPRASQIEEVVVVVVVVVVVDEEVEENDD